jgi:TPR repeat protein
LAAVQGLAFAQFNLGVLYENGMGIAHNYREAERWYRLAAVQGVALAQFNLGQLYEKGLGVPRDYKEAVKWYRLAAGQGVAQAKLNLGELYKNDLVFPAISEQQKIAPVLQKRRVRPYQKENID